MSSQNRAFAPERPCPNKLEPKGFGKTRRVQNPPIYHICRERLSSVSRKTLFFMAPGEARRVPWQFGTYSSNARFLAESSCQRVRDFLFEKMRGLLFHANPASTCRKVVYSLTPAFFSVENAWLFGFRPNSTRNHEFGDIPHGINFQRKQWSGRIASTLGDKAPHKKVKKSEDRNQTG